jgi:hypothetical protein
MDLLFADCDADVERAGCVGTYEPMDYRLELVQKLTFLHFIRGLQRGFSLFTHFDKSSLIPQEHCVCTDL